MRLCLFASVFTCRQLRSVLSTCCSGLLSPGGSVTNNKSLASAVAGHFLKVFFSHFSHFFKLHCHPFNSLDHFSTNQHSSYARCHLLWATCCSFLWEDCKQAHVWQHLQIKTLPCLKLADSGCDANVHGLVNWLWHWMNLSQPPLQNYRRLTGENIKQWGKAN